MRGPRGPSSPGGRPAPGISGVGGVGGLQAAHPAFEGAGRAAEGSPLLLGAGLQEGDELGEPGEAFGEVGGEPGGLDAAPLDCAEDRVGAAEVARDPRGFGVDADRVRRQPFEVPDQSGLTGQHIPLGERLSRAVRPRAAETSRAKPVGARWPGSVSRRLRCGA
ncbi:hypothetical protein [Streptomyces sp. NPDC047718]|uniref:hypothetical protein n=1 Tax=Streptomyces sp. NPDC047718 TaxID=3155479 RepID=UPI0033F7F51E